MRTLANLSIASAMEEKETGGGIERERTVHSMNAKTMC